MSFDQHYSLNPRKVTRHPVTGDMVWCELHDGSQHPDDHRPFGYDLCEDCDAQLRDCFVCNAVINCCDCGNYHSIDCAWPV